MFCKHHKRETIMLFYFQWENSWQAFYLIDSHAKKFIPLRSYNPAIQTVAAKHTYIIIEQNMSESVYSLFFYPPCHWTSGTLEVLNPHSNKKMHPKTSLSLEREDRFYFIFSAWKKSNEATFYYFMLKMSLARGIWISLRLFLWGGRSSRPIN